VPLPSAIHRIHEQACAQKQAGYIDPRSGLFVLTAWYLADRGFCCGAGCRHCPYDAAAQAAAGRPPDVDEDDLD
jgi:hypothetical protein